MRRFLMVILRAGLGVVGMMAFRPAAAQAPVIITDVHDRVTMIRLEELKKRDAQDLHSVEEKSKLKTFPLVVFVPGILGSKIEECEKGSTGPGNCKPIWGQKGWDISAADISIKPDKHYKTTVLDNFQALGQDVDFYGGGLAYIHAMVISKHKSLEVFSYDWRQDNRVSALVLHEFLCGLDPAQKRRPTIFVAHSMGGLVVKYWYTRMHQRKTPCADGAALALDLQELMFVGTPHYGSPEAIKVFAEGFSLAGGGGVFGFVKRMYSRATIQQELNNAGAMFPSVYQLLPIYEHTCMEKVRRRINLPAPIVTHAHGIFELFSAEAWKDVGWPKYRPANLSRETFYKTHLPRFLKDAEEFLCTVARVEFPRDLRVAYFSSDADGTTTGGLVLAPVPFGNAEASHPKTVGVTRTEAKGDGTVPYEIADNAPDMDAARHRLLLTEKHEELLNARQFQKWVERIYRVANSKTAEVMLADPKMRVQLAKIYLEAGPSVFVSLPEIVESISAPAGSLSVAAAQKEFPNIFQFNWSLSELRGLHPGDLEKALARSPDDAGERSILAGLLAVAGERYPDRPVRIIVAAGAGGATDAVGRLLAQKLGELWGKPIVIENVAGAAGSVGMARAAKAQPDGYTVLLSTNQSVTMNPILLKNLPVSAQDLAPVSLIAGTPSILAVHPELAAKTVAELIALAKQNPGNLAYTSGGPGTQEHLLGELFMASAGVSLKHVPFRGTGPGLTALQEGKVVMAFGKASEILPLVRAGKLRALAVMSSSRSPEAPDLPTIVEGGFANLVDSSWFGLLTPVATPDFIVRKLNRDVARVLAAPDVRASLARLGTEAVGNSPEAFAEIIKSESAKWQAVAKQAGLTAN